MYVNRVVIGSLLYIEYFITKYGVYKNAAALKLPGFKFMACG